MATSLKGFYPGETKAFSILLKINDVAQDITGDTVTFRMKENKDDADSAAVLSKGADVTTRGANGYADFELLPTDTDAITPENYFCDIEWVLSGGQEFVAFDGTIEVFERVSDA